MKVGKLKKLLSKCDDESEITVMHGGSHALNVVGLMGSTDVKENRREGYGILTGTDDVLKAYLSRIDQQIKKDVVNSLAWQRRRDFWADEVRTLEAEIIPEVEPEDQKMVVYEKPARVRVNVKLKDRKKRKQEEDES